MPWLARAWSRVFCDEFWSSCPREGGNAFDAGSLFQAYTESGGRLPNKPLRGCEEEYETWLNRTDHEEPDDVYREYTECLPVNGTEACFEENVTEDEINYLKCYTRYMTSTTWHMGGTARLGNCNDPMAVVDNRCR